MLSPGLGIEPMSPALAGGFFTPEPPGRPPKLFINLSKIVPFHLIWDNFHHHPPTQSSYPPSLLVISWVLFTDSVHHPSLHTPEKTQVCRWCDHHPATTSLHLYPCFLFPFMWEEACLLLWESSCLFSPLPRTSCLQSSSLSYSIQSFLSTGPFIYE